MKIRNSSLLRMVAVVAMSLMFGLHSSAQTTIDPSYLSIGDGLASPNVQGIIQDSYGLIWIGTGNGIQKYDGYKMVTYKNVPGKATSLQNNNVWGVSEDYRHDIWVGNGLGISRYNRKNNEFVNYELRRAFNIDQTGGLVFKVIQDSQHRIWATTQNLELLEYDSISDKWKFSTYEINNDPNPTHYGTSLAFTEDGAGDLWLGSSTYGLMYCAKGEKAFRPISSDQLGGFKFTRTNFITGLLSDEANVLWITTRNGVYKYNPATHTLKTIKEYTEDPINVWNNWNHIAQDKAGNIWISNNFRGILKFEGISDRFEEISIAGRMRIRGHGWNITLTRFMIDRSGIFWFGSREQGLLKYDPVNKPFSFFAHDERRPGSLSPNGVYAFLPSKTKPGIVYVGTRGNGLNILDTKTENAEKVTYRVVDDVFGGSVRSIYENTDGSLWLGTWGDGLIQLDGHNREVKRYRYKPESVTSISNDQVRVIRKDGKGRMWVGTNNGLNIFHPETGEFQRVVSKSTRRYPKALVQKIDSLAQHSLGIIDKVVDVQNLSQEVKITTGGTYFVMSVGEGDGSGMADYAWIENEAKDTLWWFMDFTKSLYAGGAVKNRIGIESIQLKPGTYTLKYRSDDSHSYGGWNEPAPDQTNLYGIVLVKPMDDKQATELQTLLKPNEKELIISGNNIMDIEIDDPYVWVSANGQGLNKIDLAQNEVTYYAFNPQDENSLSSNFITDIYKDHRGLIWLTTNEGVNTFDPRTSKFTRYSETEGLPTNLTEGILEGDNGEMWIATQNGLSQMVPNVTIGKSTFINYNSSDGLGGDIFLSLAAGRSADGQFYFGGDHGLTTFRNVAANQVPPEMIISNFLVSNKSVLDMGEESPLTTSLQATQSVQLSHLQNNLSFEFAALHFANPAKNQYAHILKGYDNDWIYDNRNFVAYTNLDPGEYEFIIRASNAYGVWNEKGKSLKILILPPWWKTWWAYTMYALVAGFGVFGIDRFMRRHIKQKERERAREKELQQAKEIEKAYNDLKATQSQLIQSEKMASLGELTAGIAHEIQNPLNFVNNFSEVNKELLQEMKDEINQGRMDEAKVIAASIMDNEEKILFHGKRADSIVKGMLQHSRASSGVKEMADINALADEYLRLAYHGLRAKDKSFNATMKTELDPSLGKVNVVPQDLGRVILNLITNGFYAVTERKKMGVNGYEPTVTVATRKVADKVKITVQDNGNGIPQNILDKIFQPFFTTKPSGQGTGLGLSMSYDIITKVHGGKIEVDTHPGQGTSFIITIPNQAS